LDPPPGCDDASDATGAWLAVARLNRAPASAPHGARGSTYPMSRYWLGCSGWSYEDWLGPFYPPGTPAAEYLPRYAKVFRTVEVDSSFYRPPTEFLVRRWASVTPEEFRFALKIPKDVTHPEPGVDGSATLARFLTSLAPLRSARKLGPVVLQFPASFRVRESGRLADAVNSVPRDFSLAVELRHDSWWTPETRSLLESRNAALVWTVVPGTHVPAWVTSDFLYARFIGDRALTKFDRIQRDRRADLEAMRELFDREGRSATTVFAYSNNHFMGFGPETTAIFAEILGETRPDLELASRTEGQSRLEDHLPVDPDPTDGRTG
jgi:uncharacterized protein YecE (DUF72 family)